ncbi:hypothetical protein QUF90_16285 [Desulfococcaceae bacterium HSG9]|nr:hypothetical protein [Desulfococcaceae bacterium HSG9]
MPFSIPIAFLIFNRPDLTRIVFESIARAKPEKLFVVADGPRFPEEAEKCEQARAVIDRIDWDCKVITNFSDKNLGCGRRVSSGIDWVFSKVEEAIFLEDDCLPTESFFSYCQTLLDRYRDDHRIMTINGNNFQFGQKRTDYSYHFSKYNGTWGWASWRRAWKYYDYEMKTWPEFKKSEMLGMVCDDPYEQRFFTRLFDAMYENPDRENTWDHQWKYVCWSQSGLSIEPSVNLVANLGLGRCDATHTTDENPLLEQLSETKDIWEIKHPPFVVRHRAADAYIFDYVAGGNHKKKHALLNKLRNWMSVIKKR